jgi:hypothetical protein
MLIYPQPSDIASDTEDVPPEFNRIHQQKLSHLIQRLDHFGLRFPITLHGRRADNVLAQIDEQIRRHFAVQNLVIHTRPSYGLTPPSRSRPEYADTPWGLFHIKRKSIVAGYGRAISPVEYNSRDFTMQRLLTDHTFTSPLGDIAKPLCVLCKFNLMIFVRFYCFSDISLL